MLGGWNEIGLAEEGLEVETIGRNLFIMGAGEILNDVLGEEDADNAVDSVVIHRDAGVFLLVDEGDGFLQGGLEGKADDVHAVGHNVVDSFVVEFEDIVDHFLLVNFDGALLLANVDHHADFFLGDVLIFMERVNAEETDEEVAGEGQEADEGICKNGEERDRADDGHGEIFSVMAGKAFWDEFAEDEAEIGQSQRDEDDGEVHQRGVRKIEACQVGL